ncbi:hypothetical protein F2P56_028447, partial [Juglans regia]
RPHFFFPKPSKALYWFCCNTNKSHHPPKPPCRLIIDHGTKREEQEDQEAKTPAPKWPIHQTELRLIFQAELRRQGPPVRRPVHRKILHDPAGSVSRTTSTPFFSTND